VDRHLNSNQVVVLMIFKIYSIASSELRIGKADNAFVDWIVYVYFLLLSCDHTMFGLVMMITSVSVDVLHFNAAA
jgi:hypothetical protein